jgi:hypothetical protein
LAAKWNVNTVQDIKAAIDLLSVDERAELIAELCGWIDEDWDRQMKADAAAGRLNAFNGNTDLADR